ncbi:MAG: ankyrin repeat domain-containing protein [Oligoflexales bacterium]
MKSSLSSQIKISMLLTFIVLALSSIATDAFARIGADEGNSMVASLVIIFVLFPLSLGFLSAYYFLGQSAHKLLGKVNFIIANIILYIYFRWLEGPTSPLSTKLLILPFVQFMLFFINYPKQWVIGFGPLKIKHKTVGALLVLFHLVLGNYYYRDFYLYHSARRGFVIPTKVLLSLKANAKKPGFLYAAAYHGHSDVAKILMKAGADPEQLHGLDLKLYKFLADIRALRWKQAKAYLDAGGSVDVRNHNGETALLALAGIKSRARKEVKIARSLLYMGANPNIFDAHKDTPLIRAVELGHAELVSLLLDHDAIKDLRGSGFGNLTAFERVVQKNRGRRDDILIFNAFLEDGIDIDQLDKRGFTLLMQAVLAKNPDFIDILIDQGVSLNAVEPNKGRTALFMVVGNLGAPHPTDVHILKLLLESGADPDIPDKHGKSVRDVFRALDRKELIKVLDDDEIRPR